LDGKFHATDSGLFARLMGEGSKKMSTNYHTSIPLPPEKPEESINDAVSMTGKENINRFRFNDRALSAGKDCPPSLSGCDLRLDLRAARINNIYAWSAGSNMARNNTRASPASIIRDRLYVLRQQCREMA